LRLAPEVLHWETGDDLEYAVGETMVPLDEGQPPAGFRRHIFFVDRSYWVVWDEFARVPRGEKVWENFHFPIRDVACSVDGRSVITSYPEGTNLLMVVGSPGWTVQSEETRMWPVSSRDTIPTVTLHYEADAATAMRGFAAMFVPVTGSEDARGVSFEAIERLADGRARLTVSVNGHRRELVTQAASAPGEGRLGRCRRP
jgi:hypothetical protein